MDALRITDLHKTYKGEVQALKGVDLTVKKGEFFGLLGPNGAGKTTTIGIITGLVTKSQGKVEVFGIDKDADPQRASRMIGVVPQEMNLNRFDSVWDNVLSQAGYYGIPRSKAKGKTEEVLKMLDLWQKRHAPTMALSGGMKRRVMIAKALVHEPRLLLLDEPTAGVDAELRQSTWDFLKDINKKGTTIILTTHYLEEAENLCKHIAIIHKGEIVDDQPTKELVKTVNKETFVLDLGRPQKSAPKLSFPCELVDKTTLEVSVAKEQSLNQLFDELKKKRIEVLSMRNKQNRLEQYFLDVVGGDR